MAVYLLHFYPPLKHAKHYIGFTPGTDVTRRVREHKLGLSTSTPLILAAIAQGSKIKLARVWPEGDRKFERKLKNRKNASALCPCCGAKKK